MSGAPLIAARAAARTGSGLVTAAVPECVQPIVASGMPELMTIPLNDRDGALTEESAAPVLEFAIRCDAVCLGPGMRTADATRAFVAAVVRKLEKPLVLDADGLNLLAKEPTLLDGRHGQTVLTPHPGECGRLLDRSTAEVEADRVCAATECARKYRAVVVLKGAHTIICDGRGNAEPAIGINTTGNAGMATGGSGDALTGVIGSLIGQGLDPWDAARLGVFIHASAGDLAAAEIGTRGLIATDITERLPAALRKLEESR
jgi:NAD(P)H-hydrate epimerase